MEGGPVFVPIEMLLVRYGVQDIDMEGGPVVGRSVGRSAGGVG
jgi:hypothetical protein